MDLSELSRFIMPNEFSVCKMMLILIGDIPHPDMIGYDLNQEITITVGLGKTDIAKQIDLQIMKMCENDKFKQYVDSEKNGRFEICIEVLSLEKAKDVFELSLNEMFVRAIQLKEAGNQAFNLHEFTTAFYLFGRALKYIKYLEIEIEVTEEIEDNKNKNTDNNQLKTELKNLKLICYLNLAICQSHGSNNTGAINNCTEVLKKEPNNIKALYRRGMCHLRAKDLQPAVIDLSQAHKLQPDNKAILKSLNQTKTLIKKDNDVLKNRLQGFFQ